MLVPTRISPACTDRCLVCYRAAPPRVVDMVAWVQGEERSQTPAQQRIFHAEYCPQGIHPPRVGGCGRVL